MRTEQLHTFVVVAEERNFTKAANRLYLAQPVVTKHIKALEQELGFTLLNRTTRSVELTPSGETFLPFAQQVLDAILRGTDLMQSRHDIAGTELRIGSPWIYYDTCSREAIERLKEQQHDREITVSFEEADAQTLISHTRSMGIDLAYIATIDTGSIPRELSRKELFRCGEAVVLQQTHPLSHRRSITISDLAGETVIYPERDALESFSPFFRERIGHENEIPVNPVDSYESCSYLVKMGMGFTVTTDYRNLSGDGLVSIPFESEHSSVLYIIWNPENKKEILMHFLDIIVECWNVAF